MTRGRTGIGHDEPGNWERWVEEQLNSLDVQGETLRPSIPSFMFPVAAGGDTISVYLDVSTTNGSFHNMQASRIERIVRPAVYCYAGTYAPPGTTGEVRLALSGAAGTFYSGVMDISGGYGYHLYRWRHDYPLWSDVGVLFSIQGRRSAGGGTFVVYPPFNGGVEQIPDIGCTDDGVPLLGI